MSSKIEALIEADDWPAARRAIRARLRSSPKDHWLLTRLGLTYYEEKHYERGLEYALLALSEAPKCPLVLWDYAGSLQMLGQHQPALNVYRRLIRRGVTAIAFGDCGEGLARARGLVADCHYRMAGCYTALRRPKLAVASLQNHLSLRGSGCRSIYPITKIRSELRKLRAPRANVRQGDG